MSRSYGVHWALLALLVVIGGCNKGTTSVGAVPVSGVVLLDNEPAVGVTVSFSPDDPKKGMAAVGTTDSQGRFKLTTRVAGDGAVPGEYTVTITKSAAKATGTATVATMSDPRGSATGVLSPEQQKEVLEKMKAAQNQKADTSASDIPAKYASRDTSDLKASVTAGGQNEFTFPMTK
ncbi:MAG: DUF4198 domain-containing protein [Planctomycetaceae bacterium]|nr:DUF4198 domain-containing protein [Planctomycetaceae bacterium]